MSVRMAIVKLSALGAAGALIGGGAVHMAEKAKEGAPHYIKHAPSCGSHHAAHITTTTSCAPEEADAAIEAQSPPEELGQTQPAPEAEAPMPGPYYTAYYASSAHHRRHHRHYSPPPPPPPPPPTPVPAPPMLVLFGAAASALFARRALAQRKAQAA